MNTLIVAPTPSIRMRLSRILRALGHEVDACAMREAEAALYPPLVLVELTNGDDHVWKEELRSLINLKRSLVVIVVDLTNSKWQQALEAALETGADEFLDPAEDESLLTVRLRLAARRAHRLSDRAVIREAMQAGEETLHLFADTIPGVIYLSKNDEHYTMLYINKAVEALTGYKKDDFLSRKCHFNDLIHPDDGVSIRTRTEAAVAVKQPFRLRYRVRHRSGAWRIVEETGTGVFVEDEPIYLEGFITDVTEREEKEKANADALREMEREVLEISGQEQRRIGRDLHDGLGSHLTGLAMRCRGLARRLEQGRTIEPIEMNELADLVQESITQVRLLARGLNPVKLDREGLVSALQDLTVSLQAQTGIACTFSATPLNDVLDIKTAGQLYRIAQEALTNAARHAQADEVTLRLILTPASLLLEIHDDGVGLSCKKDRNPGMGLRVMQYRADLIDATIHIESEKGGGTTVSCTLPLFPQKKNHPGGISRSLSPKP